jgi:hypothetical protein
MSGERLSMPRTLRKIEVEEWLMAGEHEKIDNAFVSVSSATGPRKPY